MTEDYVIDFNKPVVQTCLGWYVAVCTYYDNLVTASKILIGLNRNRMKLKLHNRHACVVNEKNILFYNNNLIQHLNNNSVITHNDLYFVQTDHTKQ